MTELNLVRKHLHMQQRSVHAIRDTVFDWMLRLHTFAHVPKHHATTGFVMRPSTIARHTSYSSTPPTSPSNTIIFTDGFACSHTHTIQLRCMIGTHTIAHIQARCVRAPGSAACGPGTSSQNSGRRQLQCLQLKQRQITLYTKLRQGCIIPTNLQQHHQ